MHRSCSAPIPKEACERFQIAAIPVAHLERRPVPGRQRSYASEAKLGDLSAKRHNVPVTGIVAPALELQHARRTVYVRDFQPHAGLPLLEHGLALRIRGPALCSPTHEQPALPRRRYRKQLSLDMSAHVIDELPGGDGHGFPASPLAI